ncbi:MAG: tRNA 2-thiouridine(34) synthase MnmA [Oscillospiraceae bacterium]
MGEKVVIGMSGGVDSSVAAAVLKRQGYDVIGVTMRLWDGENIDGCFTEGSCCSLSAVEDARRVAYALGIEYHVMDFRREFESSVIDYFVNEYKIGRTPNPCIACNKHLKFGALLKKAEILGAKLVATGHYASVSVDEESGRYLLKCANADEKDQTYALYSLTQEQLSHTLFPLGEFKSKAEVRTVADSLNLPTANKPDSQEICFVPDNDYVGFLKRNAGIVPTIGDFVDINGNVLGQHKGIVNYTIGQRKGLGIAFGKPMFVIKIDPKLNRITLGEQGTEFSNCLFAEDLNFIPFDNFTGEMRVMAKVRYSAAPAMATMEMVNETLKITFDTPQRAITPGQAVVIYDAENPAIVLGGGTILT